MRERVRWGNVGRVAGAVAVVAVVVAWPRLGDDPVVVPGGDAVPLAPVAPSRTPRVVPTPTGTESPRSAPTPRPAPTPVGTAQLGRAREQSERRRRAWRRQPRDEVAPTAPPPAAPPPAAPPPAAPTAPPPARPAPPPPPAPTVDAAEREFGFER
jgi:hypothetical protein